MPKNVCISKTSFIFRASLRKSLKADGSVLDWSAVGFEVQVSLRVTLDKTEPSAFNDFLREARKIKEVLEIQTFLGMVDVRLSVVARDMEHYQQVYRDFILVLPHISDIEALMHISTIKMDRRLPI
jgi:Lrp/AsnC family transcriptional regulator